MKEERLPKIISNELINVDRMKNHTPYQYVETIRNALEDKGLDFIFDDQTNLSAQRYKDFT